MPLHFAVDPRMPGPLLQPPNETIPYFRFDGDEVEGPLVRELLRDRFAANFDLLLPDGPIRAAGAEHLGFMLGGMAMMQRRMYGHGVVRDIGLIRKSQLDHYVLTISLEQAEPSRHGVEGGRVLEQHANQPILLDMGQPLRVDISSGVDLSVFIPRDALDELLPRRLDLHGVMPKGTVAALLVDHLRMLAGRAASLSPVEARLVTRSTLHMIAASLAPAADSMALARPEVEHLLVRRIGRYIDQHLANPDLSVEHLCAAFRLSRSALYRLLEPMGGVVAFIRERRLRKVNELLTTADQRVHLKQVADDFGFRSAAHFSRAFREQYGYSPSDARLHVAASSEATPPRPGEGSFADWLNKLNR
jgi:AraC-like DNA-binding protein